MADDFGEEFFLDTSGDLQVDEAAPVAVEEVAELETAEEADGDAFFSLDTAGEAADVVMEEEVAEVAAGTVVEEDGVTWVYEEVAATEEVTEEAPAPSVELVEAEDAVAEEAGVELEAAVVAEDTAIAAVAEEEAEEDFFTLDTLGEDDVAATTAAPPAPAAPPMPALEEAVPADGDEPLLGDVIAASFAIDVDGELAEPEAKKAKLTDPADAAELDRLMEETLRDTFNDLSASLSIDSTQDEGLESPLPDGLPDDMVDVPAPIASPSLMPPSAKWSGAPKRPATITPPATGRPFPKAQAQQQQRGPTAAPAKAGSSIIPAWRPQGIVNNNNRQAPQAQPKQQGVLARGGLKPSTSSSSLGASGKKLDPNSGFVFVCTSQTAPEVARQRLFGSAQFAFSDMKQYIKSDTQLYLMNQDTLKLLGPFAPESEPTLNLVRGAFGGRFPAQVRVKPADELKECQLEKKMPAGSKNGGAMRLVDQLMAGGGPAPINVLQAWGCSSQGRQATAIQGSTIPLTNVQMAMGKGPRPVPAPAGLPMQIRPMGKGGGKGGFGGKGGIGPAAGAGIAGVDKEGRQYNLSLVVVNFCNVGASYASKVLRKAQGERMFDWDGVRKCVKCLTGELGLQVVGCIFENYWGPDNSSPQVPLPADIRALCNSVQETPSLTGKNHKSADDEMTIKCAYRRNCRFMDNDNYRDWLREMRDTRVRSWLENSQEMLQMRYFFDTDLGSFDTLDGNVPVGLLAEANQARQSFVMHR